jgi:uncharacterized protein YecT (DUF1311 family)
MARKISDSRRFLSNSSDNKSSAASEQPHLGRISLLLLAVFGFFGLGVQTAMAGSSPSFDCGKATTQIEKAICSNDALALYDREVAKIYKTLVAGKSPGIRGGQKEWLTTKRDVCEQAKELAGCLMDAYKDRVWQLIRLHIESYAEKYAPATEVVDIKKRADRIEYLIWWTRYIYGEITEIFYIATFNSDGITSTKSICSAFRQDEDDKPSETCNKQKAIEVFGESGK